MSNYNSLIRNFLEKLRAEDGLSANTIASYGKDLELFTRFLKPKNIAFQQVTQANLEDYLSFLHKNK